MRLIFIFTSAEDPDPDPRVAAQAECLPVHDHYPTGPSQWNPAFDAWPGGPHPGAIAMMLDETRQREDTEAELASRVATAQRRAVNHLLLLR